MKARQNKYMRRGAIRACILPITFGTFALVLWLIFASISEFFSGGIAAMVIIPASAFILGSPLAAWIACRSLAKIKDLRKLRLRRSSMLRGLLGGTVLQLGYAILITVGVLLFMLFLGSTEYGGGIDLEALIIILVGSAIYNIALWLIVTLPLSLVCAMIFWKATTFPDDTGVF